MTDTRLTTAFDAAFHALACSDERFQIHLTPLELASVALALRRAQSSLDGLGGNLAHSFRQTSDALVELLKLRFPAAAVLFSQTPETRPEVIQ